MVKQNFLQKQSLYLLENPKIAWLMSGVFAILPMTTWLALSIMALLILRINWIVGLKCLIVTLTVSMCCTEFFGNTSDTLLEIILTYTACYAFAVLLRIFSSWQIIAISAIIIFMLIITLINLIHPNFAIQEYQILLKLLGNIDQQLIIDLLKQRNDFINTVLAHYLLSAKLLSILISAVIPLLFARSLQSQLFYLGGFKKEILEFKAHILILILFVFIAIGAYTNNLYAVSYIPIFFLYMMLSGISFVAFLLSNKKSFISIITIFAPIIIIPYVMLPLYVIFGAIDSIFNLRSRWQISAEH